MVMRERSATSVEQTTSESMLKPRAARMPDTRDRTPGSFCTRQFRMWRLRGDCEGSGVSYRMLETAAAGDTLGLAAAAGRGWMRRCSAL
jgi:hypothetical protein